MLIFRFYYHDNYEYIEIGGRLTDHYVSSTPRMQDLFPNLQKLIYAKLIGIEVYEKNQITSNFTIHI